MILIAIAANLPAPDGSPPLVTCRRAAAALDGLLDLRLRAVSRWYGTDPVLAPGQDPSGHPQYVNGVARLAVGRPPDPATLLRALMRIEASAGRVRGEANAPRVLDLDIIAMGSLVRDAPDPVLPHPRAHLRAFVLVPLVDVAPGWVHPRLHTNVEALIAALPPQRIHALPDT
jgi:2-amino-4-hydroxy-6-hydroxymethyldihydropteridine diphosphokinase